MNQYFGKWTRERKLACFNCCLEEYFVDELCFCQKKDLYRLVTVFAKARLPSDLFQDNSVRRMISELHCLVTIFDGQAILSSDYFTHCATFFCRLVTALDKYALLPVNIVNRV